MTGYELPRRLSASTGWATKQATRSDLAECYHCGSALTHCEGCEEPRCLVCDPYRSDDCRWSI